MDYPNLSYKKKKKKKKKVNLSSIGQCQKLCLTKEIKMNPLSWIFDQHYHTHTHTYASIYIYIYIYICTHGQFAYTPIHLALWTNTPKVHSVTMIKKNLKKSTLTLAKWFYFGPNNAVISLKIATSHFCKWNKGLGGFHLSVELCNILILGKKGDKWTKWEANIWTHVSVIARLTVILSDTFIAERNVFWPFFFFKIFNKKSELQCQF